MIGLKKLFMKSVNVNGSRTIFIFVFLLCIDLFFFISKNLSEEEKAEKIRKEKELKNKLK